MTAPLAAPTTMRLNDEDYEQIRELYRGRLYTQRQLATMFGVSRYRLAEIVADLVSRTWTQHRESRALGPRQAPKPAALPRVWLSQRVRIGHRLWWPTLPQACPTPHCGGQFEISVPTEVDGSVTCLLCSRSIAAVVWEGQP